jgi:hypothetical protein
MSENRSMECPAGVNKSCCEESKNHRWLAIRALERCPVQFHSALRKVPSTEHISHNTAHPPIAGYLEDDRIPGAGIHSFSGRS